MQNVYDCPGPAPDETQEVHEVREVREVHEVQEVPAVPAPDEDSGGRAQLTADWTAMLRRHIEAGLLLQEKALTALQALDPGTLNIREIRDMLKVGMDVELSCRKAAMEDPPGRTEPAELQLPPLFTGGDEL